MEHEIAYMTKVEEVLSEFYPGIKLQRTNDVYNDMYLPYDYESQLIPNLNKRVYVEFKSVSNKQWSFYDDFEGIDLLTIHEGNALKAFTRYNPHIHCFLFVAYVPNNELCYTKIDKFTPMVQRPNLWLGKEMYWIPKEFFNIVTS